MPKNADAYLLGDDGLADPWQIIEEGWHKERNMVSESVFSLGNEYMGVRGYAEEGTAAESLRGSYFNGIYEEVDLPKSYKGIVTKTHFMVNAVDWLYTEIRAGDEALDMASSEISNFRRVLDMREGTLRRGFDWHTSAGPVIHLEFTRFLGMENAHEAFQKIHFTVSGGDIRVGVVIANSFNTGHGWDKKNYWNLVKREWFDNGAAVQAQTIRTGQQVFSGFSWKASGGVTHNGVEWSKNEGEKAAGFEIVLPLKDGGEGWIEKSIYNYAQKERNAAVEPVWKNGMAALTGGLPDFNQALEQQRKYWGSFWEKPISA